METQELLNPAKLYETSLENAYHDNAEKLFEEIASKVEIDIPENRKTIESIHKEEKKLENVSKQLKKIKRVQTFLIWLILISGIGGAFLIIWGILGFYEVMHEMNRLILFVSLGIVLLLACIAFIVIMQVPVKRKIKGFDNESNRIKGEISNLESRAWGQMAPLNSAYDWNAASEIMKRTTPIIEVDKYFDIKKFAYLKDKYGYGDDQNPSRSTLNILSGSIVGNPFILYKKLHTEMYNHVYRGSLFITWTERVSDGKGGSYYITRSETLYATVTQPAPKYYTRTELLYVNDAAPHLDFSRMPSDANKLNEKKLEKAIKKGAKEIQKKVEHDIKDDNPNTNFTAMGNEKFDVLFGALDRNNEVEFRLLYTPIAQVSTVYLLTKAKPFGDDFAFWKKGRFNYIWSSHSQNFSYDTSPYNYKSYSYDTSRSLFINYNMRFIEGLFFDLAPLLCIPLYQQYSPIEYIYNDKKFPNYTSFEGESLANSFGGNFIPPEAGTEQILKANFVKKINDKDLINITSYAYQTIQRVTYVPVRGGDGYSHDVPVHWIEYIPVCKTTPMYLKHIGGSEKEFNDNMQKIKTNGHYSYSRGLLAYVLGQDQAEEEVKLVDEIFKD